MKLAQKENEVKEIIQQTIKESGAISFAEFMQLALYYSEYGYYQKSVSDDYYTSAEVHSIFGELLAHFFYEQWKKKFRNPEENEFFLIELGCGDGKLASRILQWLSSHAPALFKVLRYKGIEISQARKRRTEKILENWKEKIEIQENFSFPENAINGIVFSNEFFDALPFHRVTMRGGKLKEIFVTSSQQARTITPSVISPFAPLRTGGWGRRPQTPSRWGRIKKGGIKKERRSGDSPPFTKGENKGLDEIRAEPSRDVQEYFEWLKVFPQENTIAEAHLLAREWMRKIAKALRRGMVLTIDYGFEAEELYSEIRPEGTALCHFQHQTNRNFYENIGNQDITAHLNFTTLIKEAEAWGVHSDLLKTQSQFLLENGLEEMLKSIQKNKTAKEQLKLSSAIKSLIHPEGMGGTFRILLQQKL